MMAGRLLASCLAALILIFHFGPAGSASLPAFQSQGSSIPGLASLQILSPGDGSSIVAPSSIRTTIKGSAGSLLFLELYGRGGRLLSRRMVRFKAGIGGANEVNEILDFEIPKASEEGWLRVGLQDKFRRWLAVDSVSVTLLPKGKALINPAVDPQPDIRITTPIAGRQVSGGELQVAGEITSQVSLPLRVQLVGEDGRVLGQRLAGGQASGEVGQVIFSAEVPYKVSEPTPARLLVFEEGREIPLMLHLSSLELVLKP